MPNKPLTMAVEIRNFPTTPTPSSFFSRVLPYKWEACCRTNRRRIPEQMGGLLRGFPFFNWAAANGGVTNGGLRGVWPPFLEIGRNRPFFPFFCLFCPFPQGAKSTWEIQKTEEKGPFPQISSDLLKPPSLKPPFAALPFFKACQQSTEDPHQNL